MKIKKGHNVTLEYEGKLETGEIFDSSSHGNHSHPLTFKVGENQVIAGFEKAAIGMGLNQEKEFTINPEEAYGEYKEELKQKIPRDNIPKEQKLEKGMVLILRDPNGRQIPVKITDLDEESITLDLNHPLAGKKLIFKIKITDIN